MVKVYGVSLGGPADAGRALPGFHYPLIPYGDAMRPSDPCRLRSFAAARSACLCTSPQCGHVLCAPEGLPRAFPASPRRCRREDNKYLSKGKTMRNLKNICATALAAMVLGQSLPASASDGASAQADCNSITQAARDAQLRYVALYTPRVDPVQTFTQSTDACLSFITNFDVGFPLKIPGIGDIDALLRRMATAILARACQTANQVFNTAVNDAVRSVDGTVAPITSVTGVSASSTITAGSGKVSGAVTTDNGAAVNNAAGRVVNMLK